MEANLTLIDRIKTIAQLEAIPTDRLISDEIDYFQKAHEGHGERYRIETWYDAKGLAGIYLVCNAMDEKAQECPHSNPDLLDKDDFMYSIVYTRDICRDVHIQEQRRAKRL